jgi:alkanesulfonate monooxygenase SsuD/methylene tetrahydromethanopterin reductase-like flavin-dependent oxidoreductase (luciferase family)
VEQAAMVDCLSGGRLELGLGRGYQPHEFLGFGVKLEESQERFDQALAVVRQALAQLHGLDYATPLFHGRQASVYPKPVQNPIPCWGASISEASFARYGALGWPILTFPANQQPAALRAQIDTYRRVYREHGHDPARMRVALTMFCYLAESAAEANETFERGMEKYFGFLDSITVHAEQHQHTLYDRIPTLARLSGSPEDAVKRLRELADYFEVTDFLNVTQFAGYLTHEQITRSIRLFADRVMPHFRPGARNGDP